MAEKNNPEVGGAQVDLLYDLAAERYAVGQTTDGKPYAFARSLPHVVRMFKGSASSLRAELTRAYRAKHGKIPGSTALEGALLALQGDAQETPPEDIHTRVAKRDGVVWIDMGDVAGHVIRIDSGGWDTVTRGVPVKFTRTALTGPMVTPARGGDVTELWDLLNVSVPDRPIVLAWLVATLYDPDVAHPILAVMGEQGTGKSSASSALVNLVDPSRAPVRKVPKDEDAWVTAAQGSWVVGLDNLSAIPAWLSDALCRGATGDADVRRRLHTDGDLEVFSFRRCILLNGIDVGAMRGDLADRTALVNLDLIPAERRREEGDLRAAWDDTRPRLLGSLLDTVADVMAELPHVTLTEKPRMADFARLMATLDKINGTSGLTRWQDTAQTMATDAVEGDPFLSAVMDGVAGTWSGAWSGTSSELLALAETTARQAATDDGTEWRTPRGWPRTPHKASADMKRYAPVLRKLGWDVDNAKDPHTKRARWTLRRSEGTTPQTPQREGQRRDTSSQVTAEFGGVAAFAAIRSPLVPRQGGSSCGACGEPLDRPGSTVRCRDQHAAA